MTSGDHECVAHIRGREKKRREITLRIGAKISAPVVLNLKNRTWMRSILFEYMCGRRNMSVQIVANEDHLSRQAVYLYLLILCFRKHETIYDHPEIISIILLVFQRSIFTTSKTSICSCKRKRTSRKVNKQKTSSKRNANKCKNDLTQALALCKKLSHYIFIHHLSWDVISPNISEIVLLSSWSRFFVEIILILTRRGKKRKREREWMRENTCVYVPSWKFKILWITIGMQSDKKPNINNALLCVTFTWRVLCHRKKLVGVLKHLLKSMQQ